MQVIGKPSLCEKKKNKIKHQLQCIIFSCLLVELPAYHVEIKEDRIAQNNKFET